MFLGPRLSVLHGSTHFLLSCTHSAALERKMLCIEETEPANALRVHPQSSLLHMWHTCSQIQTLRHPCCISCLTQPMQLLWTVMQYTPLISSRLTSQCGGGSCSVACRLPACVCWVLEQECRPMHACSWGHVQALSRQPQHFARGRQVMSSSQSTSDLPRACTMA